MPRVAVKRKPRPLVALIDMIKFELITEVKAKPLDCFELSLDLDFHQRSFGHTDETIVGGKSSGLIGFHEEVTWRAKHFGFYHLHTSRITAFDSPIHFRDEMIEGRFKKFAHDHYFEPISSGTRMRDVIQLQAPMGILGRIAEVLVLHKYMYRLIETRNDAIRVAAEAGR